MKLLIIKHLFQPIMMINILIAMMGNTYAMIIAQAEKAWRQQASEPICQCCCFENQ